PPPPPPPPIAETLPSGVFGGGGKAILSDDVQHDERFDGSESLKFDSIRSLVCAPLEVQKERLGILYVDVRESKTSYTRDDLSLLVTIANQAAGAIQNARRYTSSLKQNLALRERLNSEYHMVGESPPIREIFAKIEKIAASDATVLIKGETGTGKELVARAIHDISPRRSGPFVAVNCAAMTESLLESELFGHEKGAFTGAVKDSPGKFELADGGTLFLDEIGEMSPATQTKLLRVLQERSFHRVGGTKLVSIDVRNLSATTKDLDLMIREATFRQDLFYRLAVVPLALPPLRERPGDVQLLAAHFLDRFNGAIGKSLRGFENEAMKMLRAYHWPGNVRELRNVVERIVVLCDKEWIGVEDLPANMTGEELKVGVQETINAGNLALPEIIARTEKLCIELALKKARGKKVEAARVLKISRPTLDKKIREYEIDFSK
ncbi:MAG: sigma-54-dependent Fis family transcriptional regulator, partial [Planctomycetes bacterium]|nr:sigma-54-dependent Fis family transcriptional regulator [Planctomycetota bacterium]